MPLKVRCQCGQVLKVPETRAGGSVRCPVCEQRVLIPASPPPAPPPQTPPTQAPRNVEPQESKRRPAELPETSATSKPAANRAASDRNGNGRQSSPKSRKQRRPASENVAPALPTPDPKPDPKTNSRTPTKPPSAPPTSDVEAAKEAPPREQPINGHAARSESRRVDSHRGADHDEIRLKPPPLPEPDDTSADGEPAQHSASKPPPLPPSQETAPASLWSSWARPSADEPFDNTAWSRAAGSNKPPSDAAADDLQTTTVLAELVATQPAPSTSPASAAKPAPARRPQPASEPTAVVEKAPRRGVVHDASKRRSVYWLAAGVAVVACSNLALFAVDVALDAQEARPTGVASWALMLLLLGAIQGAYALYLVQLPDWSTVWVASIVMLVLAAGYAMLLAVLALGGGNMPLATALELDEFADQRPELVCLILLAISGLLSYLLGRVSYRWKKSSASLA